MFHFDQIFSRWLLRDPNPFNRIYTKPKNIDETTVILTSIQSKIIRLLTLSFRLPVHFFVQLICPGSIPQPVKSTFRSPNSPPARRTISSANTCFIQTALCKLNSSNSSSELKALTNSSDRSLRNSGPRQVLDLGTSEMKRSSVNAVGWNVGGLWREGKSGFHRGGGAEGRMK